MLEEEKKNDEDFEEKLSILGKKIQARLSVTVKQMFDDKNKRATLDMTTP